MVVSAYAAETSGQLTSGASGGP